MGFFVPAPLPPRPSSKESSAGGTIRLPYTSMVLAGVGLGLPLRDVRLMAYQELRMFITADQERHEAAREASKDEQPTVRKATQADIDALLK